VLNTSKKNILLCISLIMLLIRPASVFADFESSYQKALALIKTNPDSALIILNNIEENSKISQPLQVAKLHRLTAIAYYQQSKVEQAFNAYEKALSYALQTDSQALIADLYLSLGNCHADFSDFPEAINLFEKAHQIYQKLNDRKGFADIYNSMGIVYWQQKNYRKAEEYYKEALTQYKKIPDENTASSIISNLGLLYLDMKEFDRSEEFLLQAYRYRQKEKQSNLYLSASINVSLIKLYLQKKDYNECEKYLLKLKSLGEKLNNDECLGLYNLYSGMNKMNIQSYHDAIPLLQKAQTYIAPLKINSIEYKINDNLAKCYERTGDYINALLYTQKLKSLNDSILNTEKVKQVTRMEASFESKKKEYEISILEKDQAISKTRQWYFIILIITLIITGSIIIYILRKNIRKNKALFDAREELARAEIENNRLKAQQLEEDLELTTKELTTYTLNLIQKNNHLQGLRVELDSIIIQKQKDENITDLHKIRSLVNTSIQSDHDWGEFKLYFEKVNQSFFDRLMATYPNLSPAEVKLCALTWLNLNIKDVSSLLNITPDSVKTARHRLRKKLNLNPDDNLYSFLQRF
jgi:tetratricopeptide (TPR) repeat protein